MHTDDTIETDYSLINTEPLDIYSRQALYDDDVQDTVYGTTDEFNTLFYDIEQHLGDDTLQQQVPDHASISKSVISTFVCTQQNTQLVCLPQVNGKVKRMWVKALFRSDSKINLIFALDMPMYKKITDIHSFYPKVIHATYLHSDSNLCSDPQLPLLFDGTVMASTPTGLLLHNLLDTGCHKHYSVKRFMTTIRNIFKNSMKFHFWRNIL